MTFTLTPDPVTFGDNLITLIADAVGVYAAGQDPPVDNWLPAGSISQTTPVLPYPKASPKPFAILRNPQHSTSAASESQTTGNLPGKPNIYELLYYETAYVAAADRATEELRCKTTYAAIATAFVPPDGTETCLPDSNSVIVVVEKLEDAHGPFLLLGGETWIGIDIRISINEWYD